MSAIKKHSETTLVQEANPCIPFPKTDRSVIEPANGLHKHASIFVPERSYSELGIGIALCIISFFYLCLFRRYTQFDPDEGIVLQGAQRLLHGQILYRDFFSFFTPGSYYFNTLLFRVFGNSLIVARTALALMGAMMSAITYWLARRVCSRDVSLLVAALVTLTTLPFRFSVLHNWDSTLWACLALYCAVRWLEKPSAICAFTCGSFVCLTTLFEQSKGVGLVAGFALALAILRYAGVLPIPRSRAQISAALLGAAWPMLLILAYFGSHHSLMTMLSSWLWPIQHYSTANKVPYGYQNLTDDARQAIFYSGPWGFRIVKILAFSPSLWIPILPLFGVALIPRLIARARRATLAPEGAYYVLVSSTILGLLAFAVIAVRPDIIHFVYLQPVFFLVLAWLLGGSGIRSKVMQRLASPLVFLAAASLVTMAVVLFVRTVGASYQVETTRGIVTSSERNTVIPQIQRAVSRDEAILVYPYAAFFYYATDTRSSTPFEYYQPGMHTRSQSLELLTQLESDPVHFVLYEPAFGQHVHDSWPNTPDRDLASDPVADYIALDYRLCSIVDSGEESRFLWMVRKDLPCKP